MVRSLCVCFVVVAGVVGAIGWCDSLVEERANVACEADAGVGIDGLLGFVVLVVLLVNGKSGGNSDSLLQVDGVALTLGDFVYDWDDEFVDPRMICIALVLRVVLVDMC